MKIFYTFIALIAALMLYQIGSTLWFKHSALNAAPEFTIGNADANLRVVEFMDYNCPFCREIHPIFMAAMKEDGNILFIPRPIANRNNAESMLKASIAYSAGKQGKFEEIQSALFEDFRAVDVKTIATIVETHTLDYERFNKDMSDPDTKDLIMKNHALFKKSGSNATPNFIIGTKIFYVPTGKMPTKQDFLDMFKQARGLD